MNSLSHIHAGSLHSAMRLDYDSSAKDLNLFCDTLKKGRVLEFLQKKDDCENLLRCSQDPVTRIFVHIGDLLSPSRVPQPREVVFKKIKLAKEELGDITNSTRISNGKLVEVELNRLSFEIGLTHFKPSEVSEITTQVNEFAKLQAKKSMEEARSKGIGASIVTCLFFSILGVCALNVKQGSLKGF
ncbi:MAG: hypothetical protein V4489_09770 [Chlamydiota bacterium]